MAGMSSWMPKNTTDSEWLELLANQTPDEAMAHLKFSWSLWRDQIAPRLREIAQVVDGLARLPGNPDRQTADSQWLQQYALTSPPCTCDTASPYQCQYPGPLHKPLDKEGIVPAANRHYMIGSNGPVTKLQQAAAKPVACACGFTCAKAEGRPMAAGCFCRAHR